MTILYRLVKLLSRIETLLSHIHSNLKHENQSLAKSPDNISREEIYLHPAEVMQRLKISQSTLYRLKRSGVLVPTALNGKLYRLSDLSAYRNIYSERSA